ncbi:beta-ketoacyl-[acyl-carrier-protein] synthase II [Candidatus Woesearchaeota archaeon]|nr:MAG: beta-ketoacyl-[acyl-carrier-protein] synthase II [Candidatus Woesearchaeota archaeon]
MLNRVVITGMGVVSPIGIGLNAYEEALKAGKSGVGPLTKAEDNEGLSVTIAAEVKDFSPEDYLDKKTVQRTDLFTQYALVAAQQALSDAGLLNNGKISMNPDKVIAVIGTGVGGFGTIQEQTKVMYEKGPKRVHPLTVPKLMPNAAAGMSSLEYHILGNTKTVNSACSSANDAIIDAYDKLRLGRAQVAVSGGVEAAITKITVAAFANMGALTKEFNDDPEHASRPFDKNRSGFVIGEGAGILVMETLYHARKRGAEIYAEILGYGASSDSFHITAPAEDGSGAVRALEGALAMSGVSASEVDYINAHGTSTKLNDRMETAAIRAVFGDHADRLLVSSTKSMLGHLLGGAGGVELIATILGMKHGFVPPTINYETPDPECDLNYVPNHAGDEKISVAISNSFGFGGHNVSILVRDWKD